MAGIKERLIQVVLRGKDLLSPEAKKSRDALDELRKSGEQLRAELDKAKDDNDLVRSLSALEKESQRAEKTAERTARQVEELREELDKSPDSKGLSQSLRLAEREAERAQKALDQLTVQTADMASEAKKAGIDTSKLSEEEKRLTAELDKAKQAVSDNTKETRNLQREQTAAARSAAEQQSLTRSLSEALKGAERRVIAYAASYVSLRAAMGAVRSVTGLMVSGLKSVMSSADESRHVIAQLNNALANTGSELGYTADELYNMADKMARGSKLTTEQVVEIQTTLMGFSGIAGDVFPQALQSAIDQQERFGLSMSRTAERVGRSLQEPERAMGILGRRGFQLSQEQKALVEQLNRTGRAAEAQAIIVDRMTEMYGGSAAAARYKTASGLLKGFSDTLGDFQSKIADAGVYDYFVNKLTEISETIDEMESDGTLDALAVSISTAFEAGSKKVEEFVRSLATIDFKTIAEDSSRWLSDFEEKINSSITAVTMLTAPIRILFNVITGFASAALTAFSGVVYGSLSLMGVLAKAIPDMFGGDAVVKGLEKARDSVSGMMKTLVGQIETDFNDIKSAVEDLTGSAADSVEENKKRETDAVRAAEREKQAALKETEAGIDALFAKEEQAANAYRMAAVEGVRAIEGMSDALDLIDSTESVAELEKLRKSLLKAYQEGRISQQEYEQGTDALNGKIRELGGAGKDAAKDLTTLDGVMKAIASAANDIDTRQARAALDKLYRDGKISAEEHAKAQEELNKKVAELKPAAESSTKAVKEQNKALSESAGGTSAAVRDVGSAAEEAAGGLNFFDEVLSRARTPLAEMSEAALDAFDALQGISKAEPAFDTSSLEKTTASINKSRDAVAMYQTELGQMGSRASGFGVWAMQTLERSERIKVSFLEQKAALQQLQESYEKGAISTQAFAAAAASAREDFDLLADADLSALESSVEAAKQKMDQLADSTKSTLESLNDELLQLKGTQEEIEKSKMDSRRRDLQAQLADARKDGDDRAVRNLQQALSTLSEIESERERAARNKKAEEAKAEAEKAAAVKEPPARKQEPTKVIKLQVGSQSVDVGVDSSRDEAALLSILEQAGLRSM